MKSGFCGTGRKKIGRCGGATGDGMKGLGAGNTGVAGKYGAGAGDGNGKQGKNFPLLLKHSSIFINSCSGKNSKEEHIVWHNGI